MKQIFKLPILAIILLLASLAQAQHSNTSRARDNSVADLEQLRTMGETGDPDAQYQPAERSRVGSPVEQDMAVALVWYRKATDSNGGRPDGASGAGSRSPGSGRSGDGGGNPGGRNDGGRNDGGRNDGDRNAGGGNTGGRSDGDSGPGNSGSGDSGRDR